MFDVYITDAYCYQFRQKQPQEPRKRYVTYIQDLYKLYGREVTESSFMEGSQYTYADMGERVLDAIVKHHAASSIDLMIVSYWIHEFDPDYASCGPYFSERYKIAGEIFDVCDQGTMAPFTALQIIKKYQQHGNKNKAVLLTLEQTTVPRDKAAFDCIPQQDVAVALVLERHVKSSLPINKNFYKVLACQVIPQAKIREDNFKIDSFIKSECENHNITINQLKIAVSKASYTYKLLKINNQFMNGLNENMEFYSPNSSCTVAIEYIGNSLKKTCKTKFLLLLSEDVDSLDIGYLLLERA